MIAYDSKGIECVLPSFKHVIEVCQYATAPEFVREAAYT